MDNINWKTPSGSLVINVFHVSVVQVFRSSQCIVAEPWFNAGLKTVCSAICPALSKSSLHISSSPQESYASSSVASFLYLSLNTFSNVNQRRRAIFPPRAGPLRLALGDFFFFFFFLFLVSGGSIVAVQLGIYLNNTVCQWGGDSRADGTDGVAGSRELCTIFYEE